MRSILMLLTFATTGLLAGLLAAGCEPEPTLETAPEPPETALDAAEGTYTGEVDGRTITLVLDRAGRAELREGERKIWSPPAWKVSGSRGTE